MSLSNWLGFRLSRSSVQNRRKDERRKLLFEGLEERKVLTVSAASITSITSASDVDGNPTNAHVRILQGSATPVVINFSYSATKTSTATGTVFNNPDPDITDTQSGLSAGTNRTGSISLNVSTLGAGNHNVRLLVDDADPGQRQDNTPGGVEVFATITVSLNVNAADVVYTSQAYAGPVNALASPPAARDAGTLSFSYYALSDLVNPLPGAPINAGSYRVVAHFTPNDPTQYTTADGSDNFTIAPAHLTGSFTTADKTYDGTTEAAVLTRLLSGVLDTDVVSLVGGSAAFGDKNVGMGKTVSLAGATITGADANNYVLDSVNATTAEITALSISGSFTADNKAYDGTTAATVLTASLAGAISGDDVSLTGGTATFVNKNVGIGKTVTLSGATLSGGDAGNYKLEFVGNTTADITARHITGSFTADNKVYDGTTAATVLTRTLVGAISGDAVSLNGGTASFSDPNAGVGKVVTLAGATLTGADSGNYVLDSVATATANISKAALDAASVATQSALNVNKNGTVTFALSGISGIVDQLTVAHLFSGATFTLSIAGESTSYSTAATVVDGVVYLQVNFKDAAAYAFFLQGVDTGEVNAAKANQESVKLSATTNGGNYSLDEQVLMRIFQAGK